LHFCHFVFNLISALIGVYILYIITVVVSRYVYVKMNNKSEMATIDAKESTNSLDSKMAIIEVDTSSKCNPIIDADMTSLKQVQSSAESLVQICNFREELVDFFLYRVNPIELDEWHESQWYKKVIALIAAVPNLVLKICIPVVDLEKPNENWCRLLICVNILATPQTILFLFDCKLHIHFLNPPIL